MSDRTIKKDYTGYEVAVIGMAGRFPGAVNLDEFWNNLKAGKESITFFPDEELQKAGIEPELLSNPDFVKAAPVIAPIDYFDSDFFRYTAGDAEVADPQVRLFLECTWEALEDAGCNPDAYKGLIGLYAGASGNFRWEGLTWLSGPDDLAVQFARWQLSDKDFLSTHVSYKLNLRGPSITVYTACSTSLAAVHMACRALLYGECSMALAGGVTAPVPKKLGYFFQDGMISSPDSHCRAFDAQAKGTVFGDGVGVVVLKRLKNAVQENDQIFAVIKGSFINNDGSRKPGYTAPSIDGQAEVIRLAQRMARVEPESVTYVEAHGTGTALGDPVEIEALKLAFKTDKKNYCGIGTIKSNIGHLDIAAGIAGFIKTVLALKHRLIPPSLHFETPNPKIDFENSPFYVNTHLREWNNDTYPLRAGVSSFGIGGTNVHVVLEEAPPEAEDTGKELQGYPFILLSARTQSALEQAGENLAAYFKEHPAVNLANAAYTLQVGRKSFEHRKMLTCTTVEQAIDILSAAGSEKVRTALVQHKKRVVFMFPGQGAQYVNMGLDLYRTEPVFREEMDRCFEILNPLMGYDIKKILYPVSEAAKTQRNKETTKEERETPAGSTQIDQTEITQPLIFIIEYALARLLMKWGIQPYAMIGHSIGEYAAACLSEVFSLKEALTVVTVRGKLMQQVPAGSMLSVTLSEEELTPLLDERLALAAVNGPALCTVSGTDEAVSRLAGQLEENGHKVRPLHTSHAFHSPMMDPILKTFKRHVEGISLNKPKIPFISNVSGFWITDGDAVAPGYWTGHLRGTVRFFDGLVPLLEDENTVFLEVGPGRTLSTFVRQHPVKKPAHCVINLLRHPGEALSDIDYLRERVGLLWLNGASIDWESYYFNQRRQRISLPTYPFERKRYWIEGHRIKGGLEKMNLGGPIARTADFRDWCRIPNWKRTPLPPVETPAASCLWLFFMDEDETGIGSRLVEQLRMGTEEVLVVRPANESGFTAGGQGEYVINPAHANDYHTLLAELVRQGKIPQKIVYLRLVTGKDEDLSSLEVSEKFLDTGFYSLLWLAQAIGSQGISTEIQLMVISNNMQMVGGEEEMVPQKAVVLGPVMIIPLEYPHIRCRSIDIRLFPRGSRQERRLVLQLAAELKANIADTIVAYRNTHRLVQVFDPVPMADPLSLPLEEKGVYLITGGLGGIGLVLAEYLFKSVQARLILTARSSLPPREEWNQRLQTSSIREKIGRHIRKIIELEDSGAEILVFSADVSDYQGMKAVIAAAGEKFGPVNGVIHCAGVPGGGLIQRKTPEMAAEVLEAKVKGSLVLDRLFQHHQLDFFVLCSSINSVVPFLGQVDYCAANAFLDAFAWYKNSRDGTFTLSINWDTWQEVGMAVDAARQQLESRRGVSGTHPLLEQYIVDPTGQEIYSTHLDFNRHWVLNEHRIPGRIGLLPGTAFLEMARAALEHDGSEMMEIRDVRFLNPLTTLEGEEREIALVLKNHGNSLDFSFVTRAGGGENQGEGEGFQIHSRGKILMKTAEEPRVFNIEELETRCEEHEIIPHFEGNIAAMGALEIGPRWKSLKRVKYAKHQGLAFIQLDEAYADDLQFYKLHPALLDIATGFFYSFLSTGKPYIPFSYKRLTIKKDLPAKFRSYSRLIEDGSDRRDLLTFNVTLIDEQGIELVDIEEFTMLEVTEELIGRMRESAAREPGPVPGSPDGAVESRKPGASIVDMLVGQMDFLKNGILPSEGIEVFRRLLGMGLPQVVVSTTNLQERLQQSRKSQLERMGEQIQPDRAPRHARPELNTVYAAPGTEIELRLAEIWQNVLGIRQVGINDDFFELGGDSLKAITLTGMIHRAANRKITLAEFFNRPTIKGLAQYISESPAEDKYHSIEPVEEKDYYLLSSAQKRLFILQQMEPDSIGYNLTTVTLMQGNFDREKFEAIFFQLIQRHESFRTSFRMIEYEPVQIIYRDVSFYFDYYDISTAGDNRAGNIIKDYIRPFDLSIAPLLRVGVIKIGEREHLMVLDVHHIIHDGTSMTIVYKDFNTLYLEKKPPVLKIQYKEYAGWQNRYKESAVIKKQEQYWLNEFNEEIPLLNLPYDYPRPVIQSLEGNTIAFTLAAEETEALRNFALKEESTLFMVLLLVYNVLLSKLSHQEDIVVGTPTAGRMHPDLHSLVGVFLNTLPLRNYPASDKSLRGFLGEIKAKTLMAFDNQDYPFEDLVDEVVVNRDLGRNPLFDALFILHSEFSAIQNEQSPGKTAARENDPDGAGLQISSYGFKSRTSLVDLSMIVFEDKNHLRFKMEYCTKLFKEDTIRRFIYYIKAVISSIVKDPEKKLSDIEIISEEERKQVLYDFNDTETGYPEDKTIRQLFEEQVARTPDGVSVVGKKERREEPVQLTYKELNERSDQLARGLREKGVQPGTIVAILVGRSLEMMIGLLGILKSGGAYLPIDPDYPSERIKYILANSSARILLSEVSELNEVRGEIEVVKLSELIEETPTHLTYPTHRTQLCYVIYTSGSTGNPKGVAIRHQNAVNFIRGMTLKINFSPGKTILAVTTISFDICFLETLLPVTCGMKVVVADEARQKDPVLLAESIAANHVNMLQVTPSRLKLLLSLGDELECLKGVEELIVGGEAFPPHLFASVKEKFPGKIYNVYGPTETTIWSTVKDLSGCSAGELNIGKPIANTRIYIVDRFNMPQPLGTAGELLIGGDGAAVGYLNNPELTAEKFVSVSYRTYRTNKTYRSQKIYKTGDLARWLPQGDIEFLGRVDYQVKIRGFRIELEEVEERLLTHEDIKEAVVIAIDNPTDGQYLCAYIVPSSGQADSSGLLTVEQLREYLSRRLPDYMVPSRFISLASIPLTANGKIDRKALPGPESFHPHTGVDFVEPETGGEKIVADLWKQVLKLEKVGVLDNFFALGGDSLKAMILSAKVHKVFNVRFPLTEIFRTPTVRGLAQYVKKAAVETYTTIKPAEKKEYYVLSSAQERFYLLQQMDLESTAYNYSSTLVLEGASVKERLQESFKKLMHRHEILRTSFEVINGELVQRVHEDADFVIQYSEVSGPEAGPAAAAFTRPFDLTAVPLFRVGLIKLADEKYIFMFDIHHIIMDLTSMPIFIREVTAFYSGNELPPSAVQYKDFCLWQHGRLVSGQLKKQEEYWLKQFPGKLPVLNMPTDYPRPSIQSFEGDIISFYFEPGLTQKLNMIMRETGTTLYMVVLALYNILLSKYTGQKDIIIGSPTAGRHHVELENMIGLLIETIAVRSYINGEKTFEEFLEEVKENTLKAFENQEYPFGELLKRLGIEIDRSRNPLFDAMLIVQNIDTGSPSHSEDAVKDELKSIPYDGNSRHVSKVDVTLEVTEGKEKIFFDLEYCTKLFKRESMEALIDFFKKITSTVVENKNIKMGDITISHDLGTAAAPVYEDVESEFEL